MEGNNSRLKQWAFAKCLSGKYLFVSENFAEVAGFDSPAQMIGLSDLNMIWKDLAEEYRQADIQAFKGKVLMDIPEVIRFAQAPDKIRCLMVTKSPLRDNQNNIIGVIGSSLDVTDHHILPKPGNFDMAGKKFLFSGELAGLVLSKKQIIMLNYIVRGYSAADIAQLLNRSKRTVEGHIEHLKNKLQCNSKAEIIRWAVTSGLTHSIGRVD
jgi:DNA-binding CsgD family transcriptional regulator